MNLQEIIIELKRQQAVMDAILDELDRRVVFVKSPLPPFRKGGITYKAKLVADRCGTCKKIKDCEKGYSVDAACGDWVYNNQ